jgi:hypothetical protein
VSEDQSFKKFKFNLILISDEKGVYGLVDRGFTCTVIEIGIFGANIAVDEVTSEILTVCFPHFCSVGNHTVVWNRIELSVKTQSV